MTEDRPHPATMNGAEALARMIALWGGSGPQPPAPVFHVPGEGILELIDALEAQGSAMISCRHEAGAAVAAQAAGHVTGRPGIFLAGRAPGALNATLALHTARTDAAPLITIVGQPSRRIMGREPFLGDDFARSFGPIAKWTGVCTEAARLPELFATAWARAMAGQRGPVVLAIHEEVWHENLPIAALPASPPPRPALTPAPSELAALRRMLTAARRPILLAGGTGWAAADVAALRDLASTTGLPVATSYRRRDLMPASHPGFAGEIGIGADPALARQIGAADLVLVLGMRLGEINTFGGKDFEGYSLIPVPKPDHPLIHVHPDPDELTAVYRPDLPICADPGPVLRALLAEPPACRPEPGWCDGLRRARQAFTTGAPGRGPIDLRRVMQQLRVALPEDAMITTGAGAYAHWAQRYLPHERAGTQLGPKSGAMGYGLPAAIGVQASQPGRRVVALAGDGCFTMQGEELATAVLYRLPIVTLIFNNSLYGAIAATQSRSFGRRSGTALAPIDFTALAAAHGARGFKVTRTEEFAPALARALTGDGPALIELITTEEALKP
ncbi:thiamine pyrophosphate-dependent enzyme [Pseudodonghicola flavimaris]|uniref:Thiamine pyrophosphate-dependent enzyme n=1 Tax=Pseudodonghicola flavimaris TaxID=3050036 RepID=A0ABT7F2D3_9RHOB|nr:thiamine pyrophosphate-dependent enzyme [Pseudodonghicola flavimaris]MDK3018767.1 thiamine pyrophosphate-dependent enzyme [Pseudodonghicola flavimaris]